MSFATSGNVFKKFIGVHEDILEIVDRNLTKISTLLPKEGGGGFGTYGAFENFSWNLFSNFTWSLWKLKWNFEGFLGFFKYLIRFLAKNIGSTRGVWDHDQCLTVTHLRKFDNLSSIRKINVEILRYEKELLKSPYYDDNFSEFHKIRYYRLHASILLLVHWS